MEVLVRNAEGNVSHRDREYAAKKLGRLDRYFHSANRVEMVHRSEKHGGHRIEITVYADGHIIRGEEQDDSLHAAIDKVSDKLETRLRKLKGRLIDSHRRKGLQMIPVGLVEEPDDEEHPIEIKERKQFLLKPMTADDAALHLEMVDHPFFIFKNLDGGHVCVLYRRKDGKYGLIEPES
jgi:putative sigma-54 modulation protein